MAAKLFLRYRTSNICSCTFRCVKSVHPETRLSNPFRVFLGFNPLSTSSYTATGDDPNNNYNSVNDDSFMNDPDLDQLLKRRHLQLEVLQETNKPSSDISVIAESKDVVEHGSREYELSFSNLGLSEQMSKVLETNGMKEPLACQGVAIPAILKGGSMLLSSPSLSGRTFAYLIPLIQLVSLERRYQGQEKCCCFSPQAVILLPTKEKSLEAFYMAESLCRNVPFRPALANDGAEPIANMKAKELPVDMIIGTLGGVCKCITDAKMNFDDIQYLVLDQIDDMYEWGLGPKISEFLGLLKQPAPFQTILVADSVAKVLGKGFDPFARKLEQENKGEVSAMLLDLDKSHVPGFITSFDSVKVEVFQFMASIIGGGPKSYSSAKK